MASAGATPLADASGRGDVKLVRTLIQRGADVNARAVDGTTALHAAVTATVGTSPMPCSGRAPASQRPTATASRRCISPRSTATRR